MKRQQRVPAIFTTCLLLAACDDPAAGLEPAQLEAYVDDTNTYNELVSEDGSERSREDFGEVVDEPAPLEGAALLGADIPNSGVTARGCRYDNDCRSGCACESWLCEPQMISPQPPAGYCAAAPERACTTANDCRSGCTCQGGLCEPITLVGPTPRCHLEPPDDYEEDDAWQSYSGYSGPQEHNFHQVGDVDWVAVYIAEPGTVRFRTKGLSWNADTKLKVFAFDDLVKGALLGSNDDVGGWYFDPDKNSSRVDLEVGPNSLFLMKIKNMSPLSVFTTDHTLPRYTLELSYL